MRIAWELLDEVQPELREAIEAQLNRIRTGEETLNSVQLAARSGGDLGAAAEVRVTASIGKRKIVVARQSESKQRALMLAVAALEATLRRLLSAGGALPVAEPPAAVQAAFAAAEPVLAPPVVPARPPVVPARPPLAAQPIAAAAVAASVEPAAVPRVAAARPPLAWQSIAAPDPAPRPQPAFEPVAAAFEPALAAAAALALPVPERSAASPVVPPLRAPLQPAAILVPERASASPVLAPLRVPAPVRPTALAPANLARPIVESALSRVPIMEPEPRGKGLSFGTRVGMVIEAVSPDTEAIRDLMSRSWQGARSALSPTWLGRRDPADLSVELVAPSERRVFQEQDFSGDPLLETTTVVETTVVETRRTVVETRRLVELRNRAERIVTPQPPRALAPPRRARRRATVQISWEKLRPGVSVAATLAAGVALFSAWQYHRGSEPVFSAVAGEAGVFSAVALADHFSAVAQAPGGSGPFVAWAGSDEAAFAAVAGGRLEPIGELAGSGGFGGR